MHCLYKLLELNGNCRLCFRLSSIVKIRLVQVDTHFYKTCGSVVLYNGTKWFCWSTVDKPIKRSKLHVQKLTFSRNAFLGINEPFLYPALSASNSHLSVSNSLPCRSFTFSSCPSLDSRLLQQIQSVTPSSRLDLTKRWLEQKEIAQIG